MRLRDTVKALLVRPVAFHPTLGHLVGGANAGLMLSQAVYWAERLPSGDGWFFKTHIDWTAETCLTREEQRTARAKLRTCRFWQEERRGLSRQLWYRVDLDALSEAIAAYADAPVTHGENPTTDGGSTHGENPLTDGEKPTTDGENRASSKESTSESTSQVVVEVPPARDLLFAPEPAQPVGFTALPVAGGSVFVITTAQIERWTLQYPGVDVPREVLAMAGWLEASPKNRKTKDGILRFAVNWLKRAQDTPRPSLGRASPGPPARHVKDVTSGAEQLADGTYRI